MADPIAIAPLYTPAATETADALISAVMLELFLAAISTASLPLTTLLDTVAWAPPVMTLTASPPPPLTATPTVPPAIATAAAALLALIVADSVALMLMAPLAMPASTLLMDATTWLSMRFLANETPIATATPVLPMATATAVD